MGNVSLAPVRLYAASRGEKKVMSAVLAPPHRLPEPQSSTSTFSIPYNPSSKKFDKFIDPKYDVMWEGEFGRDDLGDVPLS